MLISDPTPEKLLKGLRRVDCSFPFSDVDVSSIPGFPPYFLSLLLFVVVLNIILIGFMTCGVVVVVVGSRKL